MRSFLQLSYSLPNLDSPFCKVNIISEYLLLHMYACQRQKLQFGQVQTLWILIGINFKPLEIGLELPKNEILQWKTCGIGK